MSDESSSDSEIKMIMSKKYVHNSPKSQSSKESSQETKKPSTKEMVQIALVNCAGRSRKGVSLYAIKRYIRDTYKIDTKTINHYIKKYLKSAVEDGSVLQVKGTGASGSFKLVSSTEPDKVKKSKKATKKPEQKKVEKVKETESKGKKAKSKAAAEEEKIKETPKKKKVVVKSDKKIKIDLNQTTPKKKQKKTKTDVPKSNVTTAKTIQSLAKKRKAILQRRSSGSVKKIPVMKPKVQKKV